MWALICQIACFLTAVNADATFQQPLQADDECGVDGNSDQACGLSALQLHGASSLPRGEEVLGASLPGGGLADLLDDDPVESASDSNCAYDNQQCGGTNPGSENPWTGRTCCTGRSRCVTKSRYYSGCVPPADEGVHDEPGGDSDIIVPSASEMAGDDDEEEPASVPVEQPEEPAPAQEIATTTAAAAAATPAVEGSSCQDAVQGDACWQAVTWAKNSGIHEHPEWYPGLSASSTGAEFQAVVHSGKPNKCPAPCSAGAAVSQKSCRDPSPGDACWGAVDWAKKHGIHEHSDWYPGLTPSSSDADFQAQVHAAEPSKCPPPCSAAAAASPVAPQGPSCAIYGCGGRFIRSRSCQCNHHCSRYGNCCSDYAAKCGR